MRHSGLTANTVLPVPIAGQPLKPIATGTSVGTTPLNDSSQPPESDWLDDSRGGTRTRDPGIMSAVL